MSLLRTRLRNLNTEFSALVRDVTAENRELRLANLRKQRESLMQMLEMDGPQFRVVGGMEASQADAAGRPAIEFLLPRANNGMSA